MELNVNDVVKYSKSNIMGRKDMSNYNDITLQALNDEKRTAMIKYLEEMNEKDRLKAEKVNKVYDFIWSGAVISVAVAQIIFLAL